jgi:hypothetical protein
VRRRLTLLVAEGLLLPALVWAVVWLCGPRVNPQNFRWIESGMAEQQVEAVLGPGERCWTHEMGQGQAGIPRQHNGEGYSIIVWYDEVGRVSSKADFVWIYRWGWDIPLRYKIRDLLGWDPEAVSQRGPGP